MIDADAAEVRLRTSLDEMRRAVKSAMDPSREVPAGTQTFEQTIQNAMARLRRILGLS